MAKVRNRNNKTKQLKSMLINVYPLAELLKLRKQLKSIKQRTKAQSRMIHMINVEESRRVNAKIYFISSLSGNKPKSLNTTLQLKEAING